MNDELQKKVLNYLDVMEKGLQKAGEFAETEIPQTIREWLTWLAVERFSYAAAYFLLAVVLLVGGIYLGRIGFRLAREWDAKPGYNDSTGWWMLAFFSRVAQVAALPVFICGTGYWSLQGAKVLVAPRVVLIEEVAKLTGLAKPK